MDKALAAMSEAHRRTEERLDAFILVLESYIGEDLNGKGRGGDAA